MSHRDEERSDQSPKRVMRRRRVPSSRSEEKPEEGWSSQSSSHRQRAWKESSVFVLLGSLTAFVIVVIAIFLAYRVSQHDAQVAAQDYATGFSDLIVEDEETPVDPVTTLDPDDPGSWFEARFGELPQQAADLIQSFTDATSDDERAALLRNPGKSLALLSKWPSILTPEPDLKRYGVWTAEIERRDGLAYFVFKGKRKDFSDFTYFFTRDGDELKLDWLASAAYSDTRITEHLRQPLSEQAMVRGIISKPQIYLGPYSDEAIWSSFEIADPLGGESLWAYAKKGSDAEATVLEWMDYGRFVVELKQELRGTFVIAPPQPGAHRKQVELAKVIHKDWPDAEL